MSILDLVVDVKQEEGKPSIMILRVGANELLRMTIDMLRTGSLSNDNVRDALVSTLHPHDRTITAAKLRELPADTEVIVMEHGAHAGLIGLKTKEKVSLPQTTRTAARVVGRLASHPAFRTTAK